MADPLARIIFIGGYARTGSTLLDRLLGQIDGFESFGEVRHIWDRSFLQNQLCGCRRGFRECPFWGKVVERAFGGFSRVDAAAVSRIKRSVDSFWNIPRIALGGWPVAYRARMTEYLRHLEELYAGMYEVSGARFLVDSTKDPQHAYLLRSIRSFDVRMVHLVRDSRAVAFSWRRIRRRPEVYWEPTNMPRFPIIRTALAWDLANVAAEATSWAGCPYVLVRCEDLIRDPRRELTRILETLGLPASDLGFLGPGTARLGVAHTVAGNPMRFQDGEIEIRPDEEWAASMPALDRSLVTGMTWPLLSRYGYRRGSDRVVSVPRTHVGPGPVEMWRILRLALAHRREPLAYGRAVGGLVGRYLKGRGVPIAGCRFLDVGTGSAALPDALASEGGDVVALDLSDLRARGVRLVPFVLGRGQDLPFRDGSFDGVLCSNVLEHTADPWRLVDELIRVCREGGVLFLSWTNWYSPFGGHEWSPFHYLGAALGPRVYQLVRGQPPQHIPGDTLFPVHVGEVLKGLRERGVSILDVAPRYWPSLRFLARVPGLREVSLWNCVILIGKAG